MQLKCLELCFDFGIKNPFKQKRNSVSDAYLFVISDDIGQEDKPIAALLSAKFEELSSCEFCQVSRLDQKVGKDGLWYFHLEFFLCFT